MAFSRSIRHAGEDSHSFWGVKSFAGILPCACCAHLPKIRLASLFASLDYENSWTTLGLHILGASAYASVWSRCTLDASCWHAGCARMLVDLAALRAGMLDALVCFILPVWNNVLAQARCCSVGAMAAFTGIADARGLPSLLHSRTAEDHGRARNCAALDPESGTRLQSR